MQNVEREQIQAHARTHSCVGLCMFAYIVVALVASLIIYIFCMASVFFLAFIIFCLLLLARVFARVSALYFI